MYLVLEEKSAGGTLFSAFRAAWCRCVMRGVCSGFLVGTLFLCPRDGSQGGGGGGICFAVCIMCSMGNKFMQSTPHRIFKQSI